jgi:cystathionine beta-synthase
MIRDVLAAKRSRGTLPSIVSVSSSASVHEALALMGSYEVSDVPVIDNDELVGTVKETKLMGAVINDRSVIEQSITSFMDRPSPIMDAHGDIQSAIFALKDAPMLVVAEFGRITGVLTRHDVIGYL